MTRKGGANSTCVPRSTLAGGRGARKKLKGRPEVEGSGRSCGVAAHAGPDPLVLSVGEGIHTVGEGVQALWTLGTPPPFPPQPHDD